MPLSIKLLVSLSPLGRDPGKMLNATCITFFCNNHSKLEWYCYFLIMVCLFALLLGFLGNIFAMLHYTYSIKSWTSSTIFLFNLTLCDFTWILMVPFSVYYNLQKLAVYSSQIFCQFKRIFFNINIYGSIYFLTLISFDRYIGAVHPISSLKWWDKNKATFCTVAIWIFIFIESIPDFYYTFAVERRNDTVACLEYIGEPLHFVVPFTVSRVIFGFLIPATVIFTCYMLTLKALQQLKKRQQRRNRIAKPLMLIFVAMIVFAIAFIPYHVMMIAVLLYRLNYQLNSDNISMIFTIYELTEIICSISSCLDPIIFILVHKNFHQRFQMIKFTDVLQGLKSCNGTNPHALSVLEFH
uniref:G-protein coupled receptors family 1 profile domain-containing protein n=1 Tax=Gopherus evgoodei TaxID=1825980 RepID=A0A8C4VPD1_9SAUR